MSAFGRDTTRSLVAISGGLDGSVERFIGNSAADIRAAYEVLLGAAQLREVEKLADQYCGGMEHMSDAEKRFWASEAHTEWVKKAAGIGDREKYEWLRALGRGEEVQW